MTAPALPQAPPLTGSLAMQLAMLSPAERNALLDEMSPAVAAALLHDWTLWARPEQVAPPGQWLIWLIRSGRGWGKTRTGAEWIYERVRNGARRIALIARTAADVRDVMIEGESGILNVGQPSERPHYEPSKRRLTFKNGAVATAFSAEEPNLLRGPQHDTVWGDEVAAWQYADAFDQMMFGLRLGTDPRCLLTTTPKPTELIRTLVRGAHPARAQTATSPKVRVVETRGSTYENRLNLAPAFFEEVIARYEHTRLGRQEVYGDVLEDTEGALWTQAMIAAARIPLEAVPVRFERIVIGVDPAVTSNANSDETGIIVLGIAKPPGQRRRHGYVLADATDRYTPEGWAQKVVQLYDTYGADRVVAEVNNGGDLVESMMRVVRPSLSVKKVRASRGKEKRAEPVAALYEEGQARMHHVGYLGALESQMTTWVPGETTAFSPDRMDALVWAATEALLNESGVIVVAPHGTAQHNPYSV